MNTVSDTELFTVDYTEEPAVGISFEISIAAEDKHTALCWVSELEEANMKSAAHIKVLQSEIADTLVNVATRKSAINAIRAALDEDDV